MQYSEQSLLELLDQDDILDLGGCGRNRGMVQK